MCVLDADRSRVTTSATDDVPLKWGDDGCVNDRTQYAQVNGEWTRVFVPGNEEAVSVSRFEPQTGEYRVDRYLLDRDAMGRIRSARGSVQAPACGAGPDAVRDFAARQSTVLSLLPARPNERLVYKCSNQG